MRLGVGAAHGQQPFYPSRLKSAHLDESRGASIRSHPSKCHSCLSFTLELALSWETGKGRGKQHESQGFESISISKMLHVFGTIKVHFSTFSTALVIKDIGKIATY